MKKIFITLIAMVLAVTGMYADDFKITSSDPATGSQCAGIAKSAYWKFASNMDADDTFKAVKYEFYDATTSSSMYSTVATKAEKYVAADAMWEIKNYSNSITDFKKGHEIHLIIIALDNEAPTLAKEIGKDSVVFTGAGSEEYVYSPATLVSIVPTVGTELLKSTDNTFVVTFSQPVRIDKSKTEIITGQSTTDTFSSITASEDSTVWTLVAKQSTISSTSPQLYLNVYVTDKDGKTLEGNASGAYRLEGKSYYKFKYECYLGSPAMTITPAPGVVTSLKDFKVAYSGGIDLSYTAGVPDITVTVPSASPEGYTVVATVSTKSADGQLIVDQKDNQYITFSLPTEITANGTYTLNIPSKLFALGTEFNGYTSKAQTVTYTVEAPLTAVITPADDTELATMPNITVTFSDASVVGYANYIITDLNPADPENAVIMSGDIKKQSDGSWATKYLSMYDIKLYADHKYEIKIKAYASEDDYNYGNAPMATFTSTVIGTSVEFKYSDVTVVSTDPAEYSTIKTGDFTLTLSDAVASVSAAVNGGFSENVSCTVVATVPSVSPEGSKTWKVTIPQSIINKTTGTLNVNIIAKDANGLYVKGNTDADPDTTYIVNYNCYEGAPEYSISPAAGSTVDKIDVITCSYAGKINPSWLCNAYIYKGEELVETLSSSNVSCNNDNTIATVTLTNAITENGTYKVVFPATFFALGEDSMGCSSKEQSVTITVSAASAISSAEVSTTDSTVRYNIAGQKVNASAKGVVIVNGKKHLIK